MTKPQGVCRILVIPLDWGLGHATRCIPLIRELRLAGLEVLAAAEGRHAALLAQEFPGMEILPLRGYRITYSRKGKQFAYRILEQVPRILSSVRRENRWLAKTVIQHRIGAVISDNRFGLYHPGIPTVILSHQLLIKTPFGGGMDRFLRRINYHYIQKFSECWVPDFQGPLNLGGDLSHPEPLPRNARYLGAWSRFEPLEGLARPYKLLALISGPEPQRTMLESLLTPQILELNLPALIVRGKPGDTDRQQLSSQVEQVSHLGSRELNEAIQSCELVISRSGYTTLMDLVKLKKKAILIPTPGQTEQEYLGSYLLGRGVFLSLPQEDFRLAGALEQARNFPFRNPICGESMEAYKPILQKFAEQLLPGAPGAGPGRIMEEQKALPA